MKRYISAVLIPCLIMQLYGCYTFKDITMDELKRYNGSNDIKIKTNQEQIIINRKSSGTKSMNWESCDSSIKVSSKELSLSNGISDFVVNNFEIKIDSITNTQIEEKDGFATTVLITGIIVVGVWIIAAIVVSSEGILGDGFLSETHF